MPFQNDQTPTLRAQKAERMSQSKHPPTNGLEFVKGNWFHLTLFPNEKPAARESPITADFFRLRTIAKLSDGAAVIGIVDAYGLPNLRLTIEQFSGMCDHGLARLALNDMVFCSTDNLSAISSTVGLGREYLGGITKSLSRDRTSALQ